MTLHKPAVYRTVLCCTCAVLSGPRSSAFVASPLPPGHTALRFPVARGGCHGERIPSKSASLSLTMRDSRCDVRIKKDVVVIGGGLAGLSTALELAKRGRQVTVLSRSRAEAASESAGGMIAPQSERLESGVYLDLCLASRAMYAEWISGIEAIAGQGEEARTHLLSCGGILSPAFDGDTVHVWNPPAEAGCAQWIEKDQALEMEPSLSPEIVGAWWFPQDMSIDAQRLFRVLEQACTNAGVEILEGISASGLVHSSGDSSVEAVLLEDGRRFHAEAYISATGAWMRELMPVPMLPHKGQMMSLREVTERQKGSPINLTRVFFAEGCYIIPKRDGRIVVGSTVEVGEYGRHNTPAGIKKIIDAAVKVCPSLGDLAIERTWAGLRPVTPDTMPVLGPSSLWQNLYMAGGYWRNGVLLAPKTAQIVADALCGCLPPHDEVFLRAFTMERFTGSSGFSGQRTRAEARPEVAPVGIKVPQQPSSGKYSTGMSQSELLEMERAALEGSNDGSMLEGLDDFVETHTDVGGERWLGAKLPHAGLDGAAPSVLREPVNDYDASEDFSEERLKEARLSNRMLHEGGDTRLEAMFGGDDSQGDDEEEYNQDMKVKAWEEGAEEVAKALGAEIMEVDIDIPEGMTEEEYMAQQGPILKMFWKSPSGEDIEIPRGMNIAAMVEAGMIPPLEDNNDHDEEGNNADMSGTGQRQTAPGVFDPTAVKGAQERSTEMNELYTKVMANKAKVSDSRDGTPTSDQKESSMLSNNGFTSTGEGRVTGVRSECMTGGAEDVKEMVGYDFILQDRDDKDGDAATKARASTRDAPEGEDAWAIYEDIANQAVASFGEIDSVDSLSS